MAFGQPAAHQELSVKDRAERTSLSIDDQIRLDDQSLRRWMATRIVWTFISGNLLTLAALAGLIWLDQYNLRHALGTPSDRIIDNRVIIALLGATTIQIGTISVIIARYIFPGANPR